MPSRLILLGGGLVGLEMPQAWHSLGSDAVVVELLDRLLGREPFAGDQLAGVRRARHRRANGREGDSAECT